MSDLHEASQARQAGAEPITIGVVCDTHIPDRVNRLHPDILPILREAGVQHILHGGDVSTRRVLDELSEVAPVTAVRGNRDLLLGGLPLMAHLEVGGVHITLMHGHGGWRQYLRDKWKFLVFGYRLDRYYATLQQAGPQARVVVFGHTHHPEVIHRNGQLLVNPGSASFGSTPDIQPSIGLLHIGPDQQVTAELVSLKGWRIRLWRWTLI